MKNICLIFLGIMLASCIEVSTEAYATVTMPTVGMTSQENNTDKSNIYGFVVDSIDNMPIALANIKLLPTTHVQQSSTDGSYRFDNLDAGNYTLTIEHHMFRPKRYEIHIEKGYNIKINDIKLQYY